MKYHRYHRRSIRHLRNCKLCGEKHYGNCNEKPRFWYKNKLKFCKLCQGHHYGRCYLLNLSKEESDFEKVKYDNIYDEKNSYPEVMDAIACEVSRENSHENGSGGHIDTDTESKGIRVSDSVLYREENQKGIFRKPYIKLKFENKPRTIMSMIDTGSPINLIRSDVVREILPDQSLDVETGVITAANGTVINVVGKLKNVQFEIFKDQIWKSNFVVVDEMSERIIICADIFEQNGVIIDLGNKILATANLDNTTQIHMKCYNNNNIML